MTFKPTNWLNDQNKINDPNKPMHVSNGVDNWSQVEKVIRAIEHKRIDLTQKYEDWRNIGFAIAHAFMESGRKQFHRISVFYPNYSEEECDGQFTKCMHSNGQGITLGTFYHLAKNAGINLSIDDNFTPFPASTREQKDRETQSKTEVFPDSIYQDLPPPLKTITSLFKEAYERDMILIGSLTVLSSLFKNTSGLYDGRRLYANLFSFVVAPPSAGKGNLIVCRKLVQPFHAELRELYTSQKAEYDLNLADYKAAGQKGELPKEPKNKMLIIPANNTAAGFFQLLDDNDGSGLFFETEGDTLANTFKTDNGKFSDAFRKVFHHEPITVYRKTNREYVEMENPRLSVLISGTPNQIQNLMENAENGLFSRFIFYYLPMSNEWKNVFSLSNDNNLEEFAENDGKMLFERFKDGYIHQEQHFTFTAEQRERFNKRMSNLNSKYNGIHADTFTATVRRLGVVGFRMAMVLSGLRALESGDISEELTCENADFDSVMKMIDVLATHSSLMFEQLPSQAAIIKPPNQKEVFLAELPHEFTTQKFREVAATLGINAKTAERYIYNFKKAGSINHFKQGHYNKAI